MASPPLNLRVSLTLVNSGRAARRSPLPAGESRTVLAVSGMHFPALIYASNAVQPGGAAVDCGVKFVSPAEACPHFPAGSRFEVWEGGRAGYGEVLEAYSPE